MTGPKPAVSDGRRTVPAALGLVTADVPADRLTRFVDETLVLLAEIERTLADVEAQGPADETLSGMGRRFHAVGCAAELLGLGAVQESAQLAEKLVDLERRGGHAMTQAGADVVRHAIDVLSLQVHDIRRRLHGYPAANVRVAAVALRDRIRHVLRDQSQRS